MKKIWDAIKLFDFIKDHKGKFSSKRLTAIIFAIGATLAAFSESDLVGYLPEKVALILGAVAMFMQTLATFETSKGKDIQATVEELLGELKELKNKK